ncbi:MAG TPA: hypothetical protein VHS96_10160 [Bacteroidia bacterium]|nr:hypothetical protein [Bacteroidia bacterium]
MKRQVLVLVVFLLGCSMQVQGQTRDDLVGEWSGVLKQWQGGLAEEYFFGLTLNLDGETLIGEAKIMLQDSTHIFGIMNLSARWEAGSVAIRELSIKAQNMYGYSHWCIKTYKLSLAWFRGALLLDGPWSSEDCGGSGGWIRLERKLS